MTDFIQLRSKRKVVLCGWEQIRHLWGYYLGSDVFLPHCQALTSNSSLPHSCWAICSGDQSHAHTCCKIHSASIWHSCQRKGGVREACLYQGHKYRGAERQRAWEPTISIRRISKFPNIMAVFTIAGPRSQTLQSLLFLMHCVISSSEITAFLFSNLKQLCRPSPYNLPSRHFSYHIRI